MTIGRPSKYDPAFCETVEARMAEGLSKMAAAGEVGVCYNTLTAWMDTHPEFLQAVRRGEAKRALKLERDLLAADSGPQVTSRIFALKNAAPAEWRDKQAVEHSGPDGGPIETRETGSGAAKLLAFMNTIAERSGTTGGAAGE